MNELDANTYYFATTIPFQHVKSVHKVDSAQILPELRYYHQFYQISARVFKARNRMLYKAGLIPDTVYSELNSIISSMTRSNAKLAKSKDLNQCQTVMEMHRSIIGEIKSKLGEDYATYLQLMYSDHEQHMAVMRLWLLQNIPNIITSLRSIQALILNNVDDHIKTVVPAYLNCQVIQSISLGYNIVQYAEMLNRDIDRLSAIQHNINRSPCGAGIVAGTSLAINRATMSRFLHFREVIDNALDALTDNDFLLETAFTFSVCANHIGRMAGQILAWHEENGELALHDERYAARSISAMEQSANLESIRSRMTRIQGELSMALHMSGMQHSTLNNDLDSLTTSVANSFHNIMECIVLLHTMMLELRINKRTLKEAAQQQNSFFNDIRDWLLQNTKHDLIQSTKITEEIISYANSHKKKLSLIELKELQAIDPSITDDIYSVLIASRAIIARRSKGGSNPVQVRKKMRSLRRQVFNQTLVDNESTVAN